MKIRGSFKGAISIPLHSLGLFVNDLDLRRIPRKSLKSLPLFFSIPTAPTKKHRRYWLRTSFFRTTESATVWPKKYRFDTLHSLAVIVPHNVPIMPESCGRVRMPHLLLACVRLEH